MNRRTSSALVAALALSAPAAALASNHPRAHAASESCGTSTLYCVLKPSTFAFTHVKKIRKPCSIEVRFTVEPEAEASGHASLQLKGVSGRDKSVAQSAHPIVHGSDLAVRFKPLVRFSHLRTGSYKLTGFYEGDSARAASAHVTKSLSVHCG
jgi:hypothetical protein